jgi:hypothetical protein
MVHHPSINVSTPLPVDVKKWYSWRSIYLICFAALVSRLSGAGRVTAIVFAVYAVAETVFAVYYYYLVHHAQAESPPSELLMEVRNALILKVLGVGMGPPPHPRRSSHLEMGEDSEHTAKEHTSSEHEDHHTQELGGVSQAGETVLTPLDSRAVDFRERLRTW